MKLRYVVLVLICCKWDEFNAQFQPCYFNPLCSCSKSIPDLGIVRCKDLFLPSIPQTINSSKVFTLHLENNHLRHLEPNFLQNTGLFKLTVKRNLLLQIPDEAFFGLERSLWELDLSHNQLSEVPNRALLSLQKLRILNLKNNEIVEIAAECWRGLENSLDTLILSDNAINHLPKDAFGGLSSLHTIDLRGNNLRQINPSVFGEGKHKLGHLLLGNNQLTSIPYEAVNVLKTLKTLDLSENEISNLQPNFEVKFMLSIDELRLDYNKIEILVPGAFQYFDIINKTYLDGNPIHKIEENAFRPTKIHELYLRQCGLSEISHWAFDGLENSLQILDLYGNDITELSPEVLQRLNNLRELNLADNLMETMNLMQLFNGFQQTLMKLDASMVTSIKDLRRYRNLRFLTMSKLSNVQLRPDDFREFSLNLEELQINYAGLQIIENNTFQYVTSIRRLDFSENSIALIENEAFADIGHSLTSLSLSHAFSYSLVTLPVDSLRRLMNLEELDLSHNRIQNIPDTSFHFMKKLRVLKLQDNNIEELHKGTFQGDIHSHLEYVSLAFNYMKTLRQHSFADLASLEHLHLDDNFIGNIERRSFMNLVKLKRFSLKGNKLKTISYEAFQHLPQLEELDMSFNEMKTLQFTIFDQVGALAMFCLNVSHNHLTELISGSIEIQSNIKLLDMSHNNIIIISKNYFKPVMLSLIQLFLHHNSLHNVTREIFGNLPHLQLLDLRHNRLFEVDFDTFRNSRHLQLLYMSHNYIPDVPEDLFKSLLNLRVVDFSYNRLRFLPDKLFPDKGLEWLDLSHNQLNRLPLSTMTIQAASTLSYMDLSWNSISSVVSGNLFHRFKKLTRLDLSHNRLLHIDIAAFGDLPSLTSLDLSRNGQLKLERKGKSFDGIADTLTDLNLDSVSLTYVPELPLPHLLSLSLAYNALPTVPPDIANEIQSLRSLNLDHNDLTAVPIVIQSLPNLRRLYLAYNPITSLANTSLVGVGEYLQVFDIRGLDLHTFENGVLSEMTALKTLKMDSYKEVKNFNIPTLLRYTSALRNLEIHVDHETNLHNEMQGEFPRKLRNVTFSGRGLRTFASDLLHGIQNPNLRFALWNTSVSKVQVEIFQNMPQVRNISVDLRNNWQLQHFENPSTGSRPNQAHRAFLHSISMHANDVLWCDCQLGWIEVWLRKRRQYLCSQCCPHDDDLRRTLCTNKDNVSLIEVMKVDDVECGWSCAAPTFTSHLLFTSVAMLSTLNANSKYVK